MWTILISSLGPCVPLPSTRKLPHHATPSFTPAHHESPAPLPHPPPSPRLPVAAPCSLPRPPPPCRPSGSSWTAPSWTSCCSSCRSSAPPRCPARAPSCWRCWSGSRGRATARSSSARARSCSTSSRCGGHKRLGTALGEAQRLRSAAAVGTATVHYQTRAVGKLSLCWVCFATQHPFRVHPVPKARYYPAKRRCIPCDPCKPGLSLP